MCPIEANIGGKDMHFGNGFKGNACEGISLYIEPGLFGARNAVLINTKLIVDFSMAAFKERRQFSDKHSRLFELYEGEMRVSDGVGSEVVLKVVDEYRRPIPVGENFLDRMKRRLSFAK